MASILAEMFVHHRWANLRTAEACAALTEEQLEATVPGTAGTIRDTLMHIAGAEQRYILPAGQAAAGLRRARRLAGCRTIEADAGRERQPPD